MYSILVADDERWIRKGIIKMIDAEKLEIGEIYEADNITSALSQFELHKPDIILSDVIFPTENGCDFCEQVFSIKPETRIVMISAFDNFEFARRSIKYQAVDYLLKPVSKEQLNQVVREDLIHQSIDGSLSIRKGKWKLEMCPGSGGWSDPKPGEEDPAAPRFQLYDLSMDIGEKNNIINQYPEKASELKKILKNHIFRGRSTPGPIQKNNGQAIWETIKWAEEED